MEMKSGRVYFVISANPGAHIESGDMVPVVIGKLVGEHLTVD